MQHILVYGDSLTWGIIPDTRKRLSFDERWPGIVERGLIGSGLPVRVIEDCLNGRRTVWEDPFKPGRNGREGLAQKIEMHSPLSLVILMLGVNDFQFCHPHNDAWASSQGIAVLVNEIRKAPIEPGMPVPPILVISPPKVLTPRGTIAEKFRGANERSLGLAKAYAKVAAELGCEFFDAAAVTDCSPVDGIHLDAERHAKLGAALIGPVQKILTGT